MLKLTCKSFNLKEEKNSSTFVALYIFWQFKKSKVLLETSKLNFSDQSHQ